ncbi:type II toxin-antitoxin system HicB family antitoxin [Pseudomonas sp. M2(2023)]|uniref:type II toxin-antitoxin system HicB family antitoxin n=1 Tax=Pseudomonas sp. M2(2023) TaxID=3049084 RepID=UPI0025525E61|nr:type II toxin-antitoxin system HicB family antitoxin [Pseudomonas sp. M2(2023)]WIV25630.1 type II toxin-antitoxin system HicB family antitoxin [Pseudomonas sp. M2(2023)]
MTNKTLEYKGFQGSIDFDVQAYVMHGKILHINDLVTYEAENLKELEAAFKEAVDDYLETCEFLGVAPEKPFSGSFNVRVGTSLHKDLAMFAARQDTSINEVVKEALRCHIDGKYNEVHHHHYTQSLYQSDEITFSPPATRPHLVLVQ